MKTSKLSAVPNDEFRSIVEASHTMRDILRGLGYGTSSGSMGPYIRARAEKEGISLGHLTGRSVVRASWYQYPLDEILVENSSYLNRSHLKVRLIKAGLLRHECYECGLPPVWKGKPLTLQLDHVNGVNNDNRIGNLRFLCPNCHSQTPTHSGRNAVHYVAVAPPSRKPKVARLCECGAEISKTADRCRVCFLKSRERTEWPSHTDLLELVDRMGFVRAGASLGVSDNAVRNRIRTNVRLKRVS
ncbi:hypothetical protein [Arthrobacter methylotrophus]|uniref:hypothetical protein n=1 Tax=Arthrobacter methylotrophus TaxID=121291 RepID=UPI0031E6EBC3